LVWRSCAAWQSAEHSAAARRTEALGKPGEEATRKVTAETCQRLYKLP
jgi:hypothetical protein